MMASASMPRFRLVELTGVDPVAEFSRDVAAGLTAEPKQLSCRYFYDREGSRLFAAICELPEYYLTRAETEILQCHAREIASLFQGDVTVIELGSGDAAKTRLLLEALLPGRRVRYVPIDICRPVLEESAADLLQRFPPLEIVAVAAEYHEGLRHLGGTRDAGRGARKRQKSSSPHASNPSPLREDRPRLILWLGSNIGNFTRAEAATFLRCIQGTMTPLDRMLVGVDLRKDRAVLEAAYDDAAGVTAAFNRNLLTRINHELNGNFDLSAFQHRAIYNQDLGRIEMYLVSTRVQRVTIGRIGLAVRFAAGETIHTENSYKYSVAEINAVTTAAGLHDQCFWQDAAGRFNLHLLATRLTPTPLPRGGGQGLG
jgi:L-histidine N-alpha-methyltransferase